MNNKLITGGVFFIISFALFVSSLFVINYDDELKDFVVDNSDTNNSMYLRKINRVDTLFIELFFGSIISGIVAFLFFNKENVKKKINNNRSIDYDLLFNVLFASLIVFNILFGVIMLTHHRIDGQDEGFFINNAKMISEGKVPMIDFVSYKGVLFGYIHAFLLLFTGFSIIGSRIVCLILKIVLLLLVYKLTMKITINKWFGIVAMLLLTTQFSLMANFSTYHTTSVFLAVILLSVFYVFTLDIKPVNASIISTLLLCVAIANRILIVPLIILLLIFFFSNYGYNSWKKTVLSSLITGFIFVLVVYLPFFIMNFKRAWYGIIGWYGIRTDYTTLIGNTNFFFFNADLSTRWGVFIDKLSTIVLLLLHHWLILGIIIIFVILIIKNTKSNNVKTPYVKLIPFMLTSFMVLVIISLYPTPSGIGYIYPFIPLGIVVSLSLVNAYYKLMKQPAVFALLIIVLLSLLSPITQYPRFMLEYRGDDSINVIDDLHRVTGWLNAQSIYDEYIMGFEIPLIVESNNKVVSGFERGTWGYYPEMSTEQALELGVLNNRLYINNLKYGDAKVLIVSDGYTKSMWRLLDNNTRKDISDTINDTYYYLGHFEQVSDWGNVEVYVRK